MKQTDGCKNNSENSSTTKVSKHIPSGLCEDAMKTINFKKKKK